MKYNPTLDGLRGLAVLLVVAHHCYVPFLHGGYIGVDVFFVLSGYLITSILLDEFASSGSISLRNFYVRRMLRLYPALLLFLAVYLVAAPVIWPGFNHLKDAATAAFYISDYTYAFSRTPAYLGHTWSLSVEEQFYLTWPLMLVMALRRCSLERIRTWLIISLCIAVAWRFHNAVFETSSAYFRFDTRLPGLIAGSLLAVCMKTNYRLISLMPKRILAIGGLVGVIALSTIPNHRNTLTMLVFSIPLAEVCALAMLIGVSELPLRNSKLVWLGKLSYGVYLWHYPIALLLRKEMPWQYGTSIVLLASILAAWISFVTVEAVARNFKRTGRLPAIPLFSRSGSGP